MSLTSNRQSSKFIVRLYRQNRKNRTHRM